MKFFAIIANDIPNGMALRAATKAKHSAYLNSLTGDLAVLQSGPLLDDKGNEVGSLVILRAPSIADVEAFAVNDPYAQAGLFANRRISEWLWKRGNPYL